MQTIKGLIALLLTAVAVFTVVGIFNGETEARYIARLKNKIVADPAGTSLQTASGAAAKFGGMKTNAVVRQKIKNVNL
jgi:hypothetical protein